MDESLNRLSVYDKFKNRLYIMDNFEDIMSTVAYYRDNLGEYNRPRLDLLKWSDDYGELYIGDSA